MKFSCNHPVTLAALLFLSASLVRKTDAAISITHFSLTPGSLSFDIFGTMPTALPDDLIGVFFFINPSPSANPGFALGEWIGATSAAFIGSHALRTDPPPISTGGPSFGDYFYVALAGALAPNEAINGTVKASWASVAFDPSQVSTLNVFWGADQNGSILGGTLLSQVSVPEPTWGLLIVLGAAGLASRRKRSSGVIA
jgi:hypothetical protein